MTEQPYFKPSNGKKPSFKKEKTRTIACNVPEKFYLEFTDYCESKKISKLNLITHCLKKEMGINEQCIKTKTMTGNVSKACTQIGYKVNEIEVQIEKILKALEG